MTIDVKRVALPEALRDACDEARARGSKVAFVATMGALHEGHLALVRMARARADFVVVSIFVNPTQFGPSEDFAKYPRTLDADVAKLTPEGATLVFAPDANAMYPQGEETRVNVSALAKNLCGPFRPGHFEGVATVVTKLFSLVGPSIAVFGKKDFQQLAILRRITKDLFLPVEIVGHPIVREADGLAMSSRNAYLSATDRTKALALSRGLRASKSLYDLGERNANVLEAAARREVESATSSIDYVSVVDVERLQPFATPIEHAALVAIACRIGTTRLIDNIVLGENA
jgi:pantoate--beta-alanine ligase